MPAVRIREAASFRIDEIYHYSRDRRGAEQADRYIRGLILHERMHQIDRFRDDFRA